MCPNPVQRELSTAEWVLCSEDELRVGCPVLQPIDSLGFGAEVDVAVVIDLDVVDSPAISEARGVVVIVGEREGEALVCRLV